MNNTIAKLLTIKRFYVLNDIVRDKNYVLGSPNFL
jgi:hypothetical protein